ncbi:MAG: HDIG domain-containing protein, partial [Candidatus Omnitrophica bacterium]|nr:HDIG domain-containing protein [Candidatus Omnitrophota bacterium]
MSWCKKLLRPTTQMRTKNNKQKRETFQWKKSRQVVWGNVIRIFLGVLIAGAAISTVYFGRKPYGEELQEGDVSPRTIYAPIDFSYRTGVDEEKTKLEREEAASATSQAYEVSAEITQNFIKQLDRFFEQISTMQKIAELEAEDKEGQEEKTKVEIETRLSEVDLKIFLNTVDLEQTKTKTKDLVTPFLKKGIIDNASKKELLKSEQAQISLSEPDKKGQIAVPVDGLLTLAVVKKEIANSVQDLFPENRKLRIAIINLSGKLLQPNLRFNQELTGKNRQLAYEAAPKQYKEEKVKKEELIIARGERVTKKHLLKIEEMFRRQVRVNRFMFFAGAVILALTFLAIISFYLKSYEPKVFLNTRKLTLIGILFILMLTLAKVITYSSLPSYVIPTAIASILMAMLIGPRLAIMMTIALSIFVGIIAGDKLNIACVSFVGGVVGIFCIQGARRRSQILVTGCLVGIANFVAICAIELLHGLDYTIFLREGFLGFLSGLGAGVIVAGILPAFEYLFDMVTNISLLELSDLNHPLLKEMVLKAPGTYHHSLIVGNLAEATCDAIGANSLLARVGSYFHDIGKTEKAEYFSENQIGLAKRKHDKLTPSMSSLIITNHVKDGVELARKYKLNQAVIDFIEQHHGTSLIYFFYQRALEKVEDDQALREEGFRYPGPKPQTKETAVVLLADSAEAASRALSEPTPARIKGLVRKIINNKFIDNQLDQCELTLKDLEVIA